MNRILYAIIIAFTIITLLALCDADKYERKTDELRDSIASLDSFIDIQHQTIIQLTYQHEDDDALMEEEQP